ncbi:GON-4-like protein isoform X2 [Nelusetta ayraudi]|uniref:GON-4-like protein isoform X2 n=1 Tax=Nelusetta ayraudi TaxID=303726 RepID=UPI003F7042F1
MPKHPVVSRAEANAARWRPECGNETVMAHESSVRLRAEKRQPADEDACPLVSKSLRTDGQTGVSRPDRKLWTGSSGADRQTDDTGGATAGESSEDELGRLDLDLSRKSKQLNLTSRNVRAILHEVITHQHVVEMMKAAIRATQDLPMFEPKMTRSRLRQAVQHAQTASWSASAASAPKTPQFVDIDLEEEEDSSDEEYCPEEQEEDDTAEETLPSDGDSLSSPPRMHQGSVAQYLEGQEEEALQKPVGRARHQAESSSSSSTHHLLPPPDTSSFLERLNAVEEELNCGLAYHYEQCLDRKSDDSGGPSGLASRTRSKRPLVDVPLVQLEAELLPPDTTADMYEQSAALEEDRHWTAWLQGLVARDTEEEAEDEDDPEYNVLDDLDEPDLEDYRTDRAVQITKKEVNELLDELFDTLQEEETEALSPAGAQFNVPKTLRFEAPLASVLTERRRAVRKRYEAQQQRRALLDTTNQHRGGGGGAAPAPHPAPHPASGYTLLVLPGPSPLHLDHSQRLQLQQQVQQHVQLLTQLHLLCRRVEALNHEACMTEHYLEELQQFAQRQQQQQQLFPSSSSSSSSFQACNLRPALDLLREAPPSARPHVSPRAAAAAAKRWLPTMAQTTSSHAFPLLPAEAAWLFATRPVFLYPELLPVCSLERRRDQRSIYTAGENGLLLLALRHFEGTAQREELISSYLLCKTRWSVKKHLRELSSSSRAPASNIIKTYLKHKIMPTLPLACGRVQPEDQCPPVDRTCPNMPNWLKNSQLIIQKTRLGGGGYPPSLPPGCSLRLHPHFLHKCRPPSAPRPPHRRFFTLAHNASLLPLAKPPAHHGGRNARPIGVRPLPLPPPPPPADTGTAHPASPGPTPPPETPGPPGVPCTTPAVTPAYVLLQMAWTPQAPPTDSSSQQALGKHVQVLEPQLHGEEAESTASPSTLSPLSSCMEEEEQDEEGEEQEEEEEEVEVSGVLTMNGGENGGGGEEQKTVGEGGDTGGGGGGEESGGGEDGEQQQQEEGEEEEEEEEGGQREDEPGEDDGGAGGEEDQEEEEKDKDEEQERQGEEEEEEEEEEDFDELTQDEDEEEVMSSASEESVLSVPELQETMKQLTWLAAERRLCTDGESEEEHSAGSQEEEEEEEEEEGPKGEESGEGRSGKESRDEEAAPGERTARGGGGRCPGRGRGRSRPLRGLGRSRQERHSKDGAKLLLLYDDNILDNDPQRESKDSAFAQNYLSRVREVLQDTPERVQDFVSLLQEFKQVGEGPEVTSLFRKLRGVLGEQTELLKDFAAFLHPEQALQCGLLQEQQAFERSRRFLRQLEITFGENPSHYQKIIKALQIGPELSPAGIQELKAQMETLLRGHTHLQSEFWVFFEELRPPPARPGQFEEAHWPEEAGGGSDGGDGVGLLPLGGAGAGGFEEVTLPELEEEEEGHKILPMSSRRQRRKLAAHRSYKDCDWSDKDWPCPCGDAKSRRLRRKGRCHCHGSKLQTPGGVSRAIKSLHPAYSQLGSAHDEACVPKRESPPPGGRRGSPGARPDQSSALWEADEKEEQEEQEEDDDDDNDEEEKKKKSRIEEALPSSSNLCTSSTFPPSCSSSSSAPPPPPPPPPRPSPPPDVPVCAKNISLTASGEKVILWTREADRVILTTCQQEGANQSTFQAISTLLGNKTSNEVSRRFRDLMRLFRTAARQTGSEDDAPPTEPSVANEEAAEGH